MDDLKAQVKAILTPSKSLAVYHLNFTDPKGAVPTGRDARFVVKPDYAQNFYDLIYHDILLPLSCLPLDSLLQLDLLDLVLPDPTAQDFPEQALGLVTTLDQTRVLTPGSYNYRYTRAFFDPLAEKLARQLIALPDDVRPDGKHAWLSRGYTFEQWLLRFWIWAPLVHSDTFMVQDRQRLKDYLHYMRHEVETHFNVTDPFAHLEAQDDVDLTLFPSMLTSGPPERSFSVPEQELQIWEHAFWIIRILNAHFALTDLCGRYPYSCQWRGEDLGEKDVEYLQKTDYALYDRSLASVFEQVKRDVQAGVWQPLSVVEKYEKGLQADGIGGEAAA